MTPKHNIIAFFCLLFSVSSFSQVSNINFSGTHHINNTYSICDSISLDISPVGFDTTSAAEINYSFSGTNILGTSYTATITWGDSTITSHTGTSVSNNTAITWTPALTHSLTGFGWNDVHIKLKEVVSGDSTLISSSYLSNACDSLYFNALIVMLMA